jgi:hypothetical protein
VEPSPREGHSLEPGKEKDDYQNRQETTPGPHPQTTGTRAPLKQIQGQLPAEEGYQSWLLNWGAGGRLEENRGGAPGQRQHGSRESERSRGRVGVVQVREGQGPKSPKRERGPPPQNPDQQDQSPPQSSSQSGSPQKRATKVGSSTGGQGATRNRTEGGPQANTRTTSIPAQSEDCRMEPHLPSPQETST